MSTPVNIFDPATGKAACVTSDGGLCVQVSPHPPGQRQSIRVFRQYLTDDGAADGTKDMLVDGSSTNVKYYVGSHNNRDRYITSLSFVIADAGQTLSEWGNTGAALTNGFKLTYTDTLGEVVINDELKTNFDFIRLCAGQPAFGDTTAAFRASNVSGASEGYLPVLDLRQTFGLQWGIRLQAGSIQEVAVTVRDNATGPDQFDCVAYGFERLPD